MNGIINVYKEAGFTSFDVVAKLRGICGQRKIGHTGTLDPDATGVLPVCLGNATKVCDLLTDHDKEYVAQLLLGRATDTQDISGETIAEGDVAGLSEDEIRQAINSFIGKGQQIPPMYSALKVNGQKLCDLARKGIEVERKPREVHFYEIEILEINIPLVKIRVHCSKGTYIRTLCNDIGEKLGCYGCMQSLERTKVDVFELKNALKLSQIQALKDENRLEEALISVDSLFRHYPAMAVTEEALKLLENGNKLLKEHLKPLETNTDNSQVRIYRPDGSFAGLYIYNKDKGEYKPEKMFL